MSPVLKKILKVAGYFLLCVVLLLLAVGLLLQLPPVQTFIATKVTIALAGKTGGKLSVGKVAIRLPDAVLLKEIYAEDLKGDTMLYTGALKVNISLFDLLWQKINIDNILLEDAVVNLYENPEYSSFNFQYLIDAFSSSDTVQIKDTSSSPWAFSINSVTLRNVQATIDIPTSGLSIDGSIQDFEVESDDFDLENQKIALGKISLKNSNIAIALAAQDSLVKEKIDTLPANKFLIPSIGWTFSAEEIDFADNNFSFHDNSKDPLKRGMDFVHLSLSNLDVQITQAVYEGHLIKANIKNMSVAEKSGFELKQLKGNVTIDSTAITLDGLQLKTDHSFLQSSLKLSFPDFNSLQQLTKDVTVDAEFKDSYVSAKDILLIVPDIASDTNFNLNSIDSVFLDGSITGTADNLEGKDFTLSLGHDAYIHLNFSAKGLPDIDNTRFNVNIEELTATPGIVSSIIKTELPEEVTRLGKTTLKGKYNGTIYMMDFDGIVTTQLGELSARLKAHFNQTYTHASYDGTIKLKDFQLGTMLADTSIGNVTLEAAIEGSGLKIDSLQAGLKARIKEIAYRNYTYRDIGIDGNLDKKKFTGHINIDDENILFDFNGMVDLNDSVPIFEFSAALDTINLGALNLLENNVGIHADIEMDFRGLNLDDFSGRGAIKNIRVSSDSLHYSMDSITAKAYNEGVNNKIVELASPLVNAKISGDFNAADLPRLLINYVNDYFPISVKVDSVDKPKDLAIEPGKPVLADQKMDILVTVSKPLKLVQMFIPQITRWDTAYIVGNFDSKEKSLVLDAALPGLQYGELKIDSVLLKVAGDKNDLKVLMIIDDAQYGDKTTIPDAEISLSMADDNMDASMSIGGDSIRRLGIDAHVTRRPDDAFRIAFEDTMHISGKQWTLPENNYIDYRPGYVHFNNVRLENNEQQLSIISTQDSAGAPITVAFKNFDLNELSNLADYDDIKLDGDINGSVKLLDIHAKPSFIADVSINNIYANDQEVGDLRVKAAQQGEAIAMNANLTGGENQLLVSGKFFPSNSSLELEADMKRLNLNAADPFLQDFISESSGYISANLSVKGEVLKPSVTGKIEFHGVSTKSTFANARFTIVDNTVEISPERININRLRIFDEQHREATIHGSLKHKNFENIELDLSLNTDEFMFLNTKDKKRGFFYGTVILAIDGTIRGPLEVPVVDARASTKPGTKVFIKPAAMESEIKKEDFVIFRTPPYDNIENIDSLTLTKQPDYNVNLSGVDLNLAFELTPDAQLQIIIDPISGDSLTCFGSANLVVDIPPGGTPQITGAYIVNRGSYAFSYQKLLKRKFTINKDSRIDFTGDIMNARLGVTAQYTVNATTYDLIASQSASLSESEAEAAKRRSPVYVILKVKGEIARPELSFDIQLPPDESNLVSSTVARKLSSLREDPTELNKQVFALLVFNAFMAEESSGPDLETTGENVALRSVSNLISNQLNRLANKVKGFEINLNLNSYKSKYETAEGNDMLTEIGVDISKQFLNERLEVTVGGNVNMENTTTGQTQGGFSYVSGDFTIEYKLTPSGKYRVKVYQTSDFDALDQSNIYRTGIGLTYRASFRNLLKKKKEQENKSSKP